MVIQSRSYVRAHDHELLRRSLLLVARNALMDNRVIAALQHDKKYRLPVALGERSFDLLFVYERDEAVMLSYQEKGCASMPLARITRYSSGQGTVTLL